VPVSSFARDNGAGARFPECVSQRVLYMSICAGGIIRGICLRFRGYLSVCISDDLYVMNCKVCLILCIVSFCMTIAEHLILS